MLTGLFAVSTLFAGLAAARAEDGILVPGDAVVTGFSGVMPTGAPPPGRSPLDMFFINPEGPSARILSFGAFGGPPRGQLVTAAPKKVVKAKDIGQVFAVGLDDGLGAAVPNIYLGATAAFGLHIARPDPATPGKFIRLKTGRAEARWMAGMFGPGPAGGPGAIYKIDGMTGTAALFATLPANSGAGVGDVVFDKTSKHFYASDLDSGLIHRIDSTGVLVDSFDHGVVGRPAKGLAALPDDGRIADITDPAFDVENPDTWGFTQSERRVHGMAVHQGRLYYAVAAGHQVWSVGLADDGSFAGDPRWELDVKDLTGAGPITDMLFDKQGRMHLAQRGTQQASYSYTAFADADEGVVVRYRREQPDDLATDGVWAPDRDEYAVAITPQHRRSNGGIALGYAHANLGLPDVKACGNTLWSTGDRLRTSSGPDAMLGEVGGAGPAMPPDPDAEPDVHGLQGNDIALVRPANEPPNKAYFVDYDGNFGDPTAVGHIGDVEIWQPCQTDYAGYESIGGEGGYIPPGYLPPIEEPPGELPPVFPPPEPYNTNLRIAKWAILPNCIAGGAGHLCPFRVRVTNDGPDVYFGDIKVSDTLSASPPGAITAFLPASGWTCWNSIPGTGNYECWRPSVFLLPGASIELTMMTYIPNAAGMCHLSNRAEIVWAPGGSQWNTDPTDDVAFAAANIPAPFCPTNRNLRLVKTFNQCWDQGGGTWHCQWDVTVLNTGPGVYAGTLEVRDTLVAAPVGISFNPPWNCVQAPAQNFIHAKCVHPFTVIPPGGQRVLSLGGGYSESAIQARGCQIPNTAELAFPIGGTFYNTNPADDTGNANAAVPPIGICVAPAMNKIECPPGFADRDGQCTRIVPQPPKEPDSLVCPADMEKVRLANVFALRRKGWTLIRLRDGQWCGGPGKPAVIECPRGTNPVPTNRVSALRQAGWTLVRLPNKRWCGKPGKPKPPVIECPRGMRKVAASQLLSLREQGWTLTRVRGRWCGKPGKPPVRGCNKGERTVRSARLAAALRRQGLKVRQISRARWCASGRPIKPCKRGEVRRNGKCVLTSCPRGFTGQPPKCRKIGKPTRPEQTGPRQPVPPKKIDLRRILPKSCPPNTYRAPNGRCTVLR